MKAQRLGDAETEDGEEGFDPFRRRGGRLSLGGAVGRSPRTGPRAAVGVAAAGLGGPTPVTPIFGGGGGRPVDFYPEVER